MYSRETRLRGNNLHSKRNLSPDEGPTRTPVTDDTMKQGMMTISEDSLNP